ncbi:MAG: mRNA interferase RelE/StbE [Blastocatellia bacterium]
MRHRITIAPTALRQLKGITDQRVRAKIIETINRLVDEPEKQGKPLVGELAGYRSLRAVGQRYRIIYTVNQNEITVIVVAVGLRRAGSHSDIYELARKLVGVALKGAPTVPTSPTAAKKKPAQGKRSAKKKRTNKR